MEIAHDPDKNLVWCQVEGHTATVEYEVKEGTLDILHTRVPAPLEGHGLASQLVQWSYDYARRQGLRPAATCSYAQAWLKRHPEYVVKE